jgi:predicted amidophosphoribosyltransferase
VIQPKPVARRNWYETRRRELPLGWVRCRECGHPVEVMEGDICACCRAELAHARG